MNEGNKDVREALGMRKKSGDNRFSSPATVAGLLTTEDLAREAAEQLAAIDPAAFSDEEHFWFVSRRIAEAGKVVAGEERRHS